MKTRPQGTSAYASYVNLEGPCLPKPKQRRLGFTGLVACLEDCACVLVLAGIAPTRCVVLNHLYALQSDLELVGRPLVYCVAEDPGLRQTGGEKI